MTELEVPAGAGEVSAAVGDTVVFRLPENATTGYVWSVAERAAGLAVADSMVPTEGTTAGGGGEHVFHLRAERPGVWRLRFRLAREWESAALDERFLTVRAS
ncbi:protease inhibitor I42 family protein [Kribbella sp. NPDC003557]|uniref:protease inhibitor I42 family protein n=1 Tax=Kribbella sp. NPDC003557 TaxID=3154449 RepID=UPI0033B3A94F